MNTLYVFRSFPGSMTGCLTSEGGREVLTVNVNQINQDLIRQVNTVLSQQPHIGGAEHQQAAGGGAGGGNGSNMPSQAQRR